LASVRDGGGDEGNNDDEGLESGDDDEEPEFILSGGGQGAAGGGEGGVKGEERGGGADGAGGEQHVTAINMQKAVAEEKPSLFEMDLDLVEGKPWRNPGAKVSDWFNYGFNEETWRVYCRKQQKLRDENRMQGKIEVVATAPAAAPVEREVRTKKRVMSEGGLLFLSTLKSFSRLLIVVAMMLRRLFAAAVAVRVRVEIGVRLRRLICANEARAQVGRVMIQDESGAEAEARTAM
jgi:hypothetical protein